MAGNMKFGSWAENVSEKLDEPDLGFMWHNSQKRHTKANLN
jgi:hypothetical protein